MEADGVFAIKSPEEALALYRKSVSAPGEALSALTSAPVFKGRATVQREMLRFYLEQDDSLEFVSFSCDLNPKILEKNPSKLFRGGLGIAHSQTTGSTAKGIGFPFAISRAPITVSDGVLAKYLCFRNSLSPGFSGETLATNFLSLNSSISELIGAEELRTKLLAKLIESEFSTLLERTVTNAHVITEAQQNQFYHEVLVPSFPING